MKQTILIAISAVLSVGCGSKSSKAPIAPQDQSGEEANMDAVLAENDGPLAGLVNGEEWVHLGGIVIKETLGEAKDLYRFIFAEKAATKADCDSFFAFQEPSLTAYGKKEIGEYSPSSVERLFVFQPGNKNTASGLLRVSSISDGQIEGSVAAEFGEEDMVVGTFKLVDCGD
jgi:hypothetical protein